MELKRYVLMNNNTIITDIRPYSYDDKRYEYISKKVNGVTFYNDLITKNIVKTSNNILDLVEVGDLIEIESSVYLHRVYEQIYKGLNNQVLPYIYMNVHSESQYPLKDVNREVITAIYKRQQNGDYKRYEVKS